MKTLEIGGDHGRVGTQPFAFGVIVRRIPPWCGILAALLYGAMLALVSLRWSEYRSASPMHLRDTQPTLTDALHIAFAMAWLVLMLVAIGFAAAEFDRFFRRYSAFTVAIFVAFGLLSAKDGPRIAANLPTPWLGVWERINIGAALLWIVALATALLQASAPPRRAHRFWRAGAT